MTEKRQKEILVFVLRGLLLFIFITVGFSLLLHSCVVAPDKQEDTTMTTVLNQDTDDWILIGDKNNCQIYYKHIEFGLGGGATVFWTICNDDISSQSSVAVN